MELSDLLSKTLNDALKEKYGNEPPSLRETLEMQLQVQEFFMDFMEETTEFLQRFREE